MRGRHAAYSPFLPIRFTGANKAMVQGALSLAHVGPGLYDVVATVLAGRQPLGAVEREIIIGQER